MRNVGLEDAEGAVEHSPCQQDDSYSPDREAQARSFENPQQTCDQHQRCGGRDESGEAIDSVAPVVRKDVGQTVDEVLRGYGNEKDSGQKQNAVAAEQARCKGKQPGKQRGDAAANHG